MEHRVHPLLPRTPVSLYERICCCTIKISVISARAATVNFFIFSNRLVFGLIHQLIE